jgi:hypothetical protein
MEKEMKSSGRNMLILLLIAGITLTGFAQTKKAGKQKPAEKMNTGTLLTGYLVDKMCAMSMVKREPQIAMEKARKHPVACAFHDDYLASGFGLMIDGKFQKFTADGDSLALDYLKKTKVKDNVLVDVLATREGELLKVSKITQVREETKMRK